MRHLSARVAPPDWMWGPTIPNGSGCVLVVPGIGNGGITHQDGSMVQLVGGVGVPAQPSGCVLVGVSLGASGAIGGGQHTASQQTSASGRPSLSQGGAGYIMLGVLEFWWELGGWAMAEFYRELRERPGLQFDLCFMGRTEPLASRSSFTPLHWERKSHASCLHGVAPAPIGVPPACGSAAAVVEVATGGGSIWRLRVAFFYWREDSAVSTRHPIHTNTPHSSTLATCPYAGLYKTAHTSTHPPTHP